MTDKLHIKDTGERMIPEFSKGQVVYGEHIVRYESVLPFVKNKQVLDIASGSGYGTKILASLAKSVIGVDVDKSAIEYSEKNFKAENARFILGDGAKIPLEDNQVDVVVSFETIEHIEDYKTFMKEVKRVLKKDGVLILSTPNDIEYTEENHFHIHEFNQNELESLVKKHYKNYKTYYQVNWVYSAIFDINKISSEWAADINTMNRSPVNKDKALYFFIIASDSELSVNVESLAVISEHWSARRNREKELKFKKHMDDQLELINHFKRESEQEKQRNDSVDQQLEEISTELSRLKNTKYWKTGTKIHSIITKLKLR